MILVALLAAAAALPRLADAPEPGRTPVPAPSIEMRVDRATATSVPWIDANGWRFMRGLDKVVYEKLPPGSAALAAAEAYTYGADALLVPAPEDKPAVEAMLRFLASIDRRRMPVRGNIGVVDDGSEEIDEVLNLLGRRNLLYRVSKKPDASLGLVVQPGSKEFPKDSLADPNDFAARVRERIGDEKRLVRIYGTYTVLAHLTGEGPRARLHLLNYARRPVRDVRVRVLGVYETVKLSEASDQSVQAADVAISNGGTELTVPLLKTYAVVDFESKH